MWIGDTKKNIILAILKVDPNNKRMIILMRQKSLSVCVCFSSSDYRGCVLSPEVLKIGEVAGSWRESVKYCEDNHLDMVSFPNTQLQNHIYDKVIQDNNGSLQEVWIGLRRSSQTGEWYWLSQEPFGDTNWAQGEPGTVNDGQCAILSLKHHFGWSDKDCCDDAHPVCYKSPDFLPT